MKQTLHISVFKPDAQKPSSTAFLNFAKQQVATLKKSGWKVDGTSCLLSCADPTPAQPIPPCILTPLNLLFAAGLLAVLWCAGCASTPSKLERTLANVQTNYAPALVIQTNVVTVVQYSNVVQTITVTNAVGVPVPIFQTNAVPVNVSTTNYVLQTNLVPIYTLTPNATSQAIAATAGTATNLFMPGLGGLVTSGLLGVLSIWLGYRNRQFAGKNDALTQSAGVLANIIETGREVLAKTPQGQQAANAFTQWMVSHQAETQTIAQISELVRNNVDNQEAQAAANQILALIGQTPAPAARPPA